MLCAALTGFAVLVPLSLAVASNDDVYTVGNYPVDAQAANAVAAKDKALAEGQQAAFRSLLKRVVPVTDYDRLKRLTVLKSVRLLRGRLRPLGAQFLHPLHREPRLLLPRQTPCAPSCSRRASPSSRSRRARSSSSRSCAMRRARPTPAAPRARGPKPGRASTSSTRSTPIELQPLKPVIHADTLQMLIEGRGSAERILAGEYGSPYVVVAIAEIDAAASRLNVTLAGIDAVGPFNLKRSYRVFDGDTGYSMELAAVVGQGVLEGRWKALKAGAGRSSHGGASVSLQAEYGSLAEWREIRQQLLAVPGVDDIRIESESARSATLTLRYPGGADALANALYGQRLSLESGSGDI